jgi:DNA-binding transcriptional LysR family regulator
MDIRALRYFVEVVDQQSFTKAAVKLHLTQPTVSKMVQQLESSLGLKLLDRPGRVMGREQAQWRFEQGHGLAWLTLAKEFLCVPPSDR